MIEKNSHKFIGYTEPPANFPRLIYISNSASPVLKANPSFTIIGKNFDFIINTKYVTEFRLNGTIVNEYPILTNDVISCIVSFPDSTPNQDEIFAELKTRGHLVFVNEYDEN